uniref:Si:ch211-59p23.1 n=1 Tax=Paramormyrops kingsleyae TaxID=1676925 RepID=A0A3B3QK26_9TELE
MASGRTSLEGLKNITQTSSKAGTDSAGSSSPVVSPPTVADEASRQMQTAIDTAAGTASDAIEDFKQKLDPK